MVSRVTENKFMTIINTSLIMVCRKRRAAPGWGKQGKYETDPSTGEQLYRDGSGMLYEWDAEKKAWFPRIDDDFMAQYQMNYGFTKDGVAEPTRPDEPKPEEEGEPKAKKAKGAAEPAKAKWFEEDEAKTTKESIALFEISGYPILFCPDLHVANTSPSKDKSPR